MRRKRCWRRCPHEDDRLAWLPSFRHPAPRPVPGRYAVSFDPSPDFGDIACSMESLALAIEVRDAYTRGHCDRTGRIARALGQCFDLEPAQLEQLELAAHFHDVGKIGVPDRVLLHPGTVPDDDWPAIRAHSELGERIFLASGHAHASEVATLIRHHHEAMDGSGYPDGLAGDAIPLGAPAARGRQLRCDDHAPHVCRSPQPRNGHARPACRAAPEDRSRGLPRVRTADAQRRPARGLSATAATRSAASPRRGRSSGAMHWLPARGPRYAAAQRMHRPNAARRRAGARDSSCPARS